jgi:DNA-binding response OmpR family regulator
MRPKKVILCVHGDEQSLSTVAFMLATNGFRVLRAASGAEALALASSEALDLVMIGFELPDMNGIELAGKLKNQAWHIPVLLTGDAAKLASLLPLADGLLDAETPAIELLQKIRVMSARKRGPRRGAPPTAAQLARYARSAASPVPGASGFQSTRTMPVRV